MEQEFLKEVEKQYLEFSNILTKKIIFIKSIIKNYKEQKQTLEIYKSVVSLYTTLNILIRYENILKFYITSLFKYIKFSDVETENAINKINQFADFVEDIKNKIDFVYISNEKNVEPPNENFEEIYQKIKLTNSKILNELSKKVKIGKNDETEIDLPCDNSTEIELPQDYKKIKKIIKENLDSKMKLIIYKCNCQMKNLKIGGAVISPCSVLAGEGKICISPESAKLIRELLPKPRPDVVGEIIETAVKFFGLNKQIDLLDLPIIKNKLGGIIIGNELENFKPVDDKARTTNELINNIHIDEILKPYKKAYTDFYPIPFQMIDFMDDPSSALRKLDFSELIKQGKTRFGVVLNTDVSTGRGKHWFGIFFDFRAESFSTEKPTQEKLLEKNDIKTNIIYFFNSSGRQPVPKLKEWIDKKIETLNSQLKKPTELIIVSTRQVQFDQTECGVYSLYFITWCVENPDKNPTEFINQDLSYKKIFNYRRALFGDGGKM
jgi:hypothetical protein